MPRLRVIVLDQLPGPRPQYRVALWADVPASRQSFYANAALTSAWTGALATDNAALQTGSVAERLEVYSADPPATLAAVKAALQLRWAAFQAEITAFNPWSRYASTWDGVAWVDAGAS